MLAVLAVECFHFVKGRGGGLLFAFVCLFWAINYNENEVLFICLFVSLILLLFAWFIDCLEIKMKAKVSLDL